MGRRSKVEPRALGLYNWLKGHVDEPITGSEWVARAGNYTLSDTTRRAIKRVAELADEEGLCLRVPCHANGYTYCLTTEPAHILPARKWLRKTEVGMGKRRKMHDDVAAAHLDSLPEGKRKEAERVLQLRALVDEFSERVDAILDEDATA